MRKKILMVLLASCLVVNLLPVSVFAAGTGVVDAFEVENEMDAQTEDAEVLLEDGTLSEGDGGSEGMENEPMVFAATANSGACGENLTWTLDDKGVLTISGTGPMYNYSVWRDNKAVREVVIQPGVTIIGEHAFADCNDMTSIIIPDSVTSIGSHAFYSCNSLTSIVIPNSVTSIGERAFGDCRRLTSITIPSSVTSIGDAAFAGSLSSIHVDINNANYCSDNGVLFNKDKTLLIQYPHEHPDRMYRIPDSVTGIGSSAFEDCRSLTSVTIPNSVTSIGDRSFFRCISLTDITIPDSVASIGNAAFYDCVNLTGITLPDSVTSIGSGAFYGCCKLTSIAIPDSVTSIGSGVFEECGSLTNITLPDSMTSIGNYTFLRCGSLINITIPDSVTSIGDKAFWGCGSLTNITIPDSVTSIGNSAFDGCVNLTSITIPDSVTSIGSGVFEECSSLTNITLPDGVVFIGNGMFKGCSNLTSITLPDGVISIGSHAFENCSRLTNITIPDSVTSIWSWAFEDCSRLTNITLPNSVTSIDNGAFYGCDRLTDIYYSGDESDWKAIKVGDWNEPLSNATIHYNSTGPDDLGAEPINGILRSGDGWTIRWECNYKLDRNGNPRNGRIEISVNDTNTKEELYLYNEASELGFPWELEPYNIPKSAITTLVIRGKPTKKLRITADSFKGYSNLKNVVLEYVSGIDSNSFEGCSSLQCFGFLSDGTPLSVIDNGSFRNCTSLTEIDFPASLKRIGAEAFKNTALKTITLGSNIKEIGKDAFSGCDDLLIYCIGGSYAHRYAQENDLPFRLTVDPTLDVKIRTFEFSEPETVKLSWGWNMILDQGSSSSVYNHDIAAVALALSAASERSQDAIESMLAGNSFGVDLKKSFYYGDENKINYPACTFAHKTINNGGSIEHIIIIVGRGTDISSKDPITDLASITDHFKEPASNVWDTFLKWLDDNKLTDVITGSNTKFFVTGHSLGGAVANRIAYRLTRDYGSANVYAYTFGTPPTEGQSSTCVPNIFNVLYDWDPVPFLGVFTDGRYGVECWFTDGSTGRFLDKHYVETYMDRLLKHEDDQFKKTFKSCGAWCPVDLKIFDSSGKLVGSVTDNIVDEENITDSVVIILSGSDNDQKNLYFMDDDTYTIKFTGTDEGTLTYTIRDISADKKSIIEQTYANVRLYDGKQMVSKISVWDKDDDAGSSGDKIDTTEVQLFVLDENGEAVKEVLPDGNGTEVNRGTEKFASYEGFDFYRDTAGNITCLDSTGAPVINEFKCDGIYTYYFQADGTAMKDRLTYHPDGVHVIYFDGEGHETFDSFALVGHNIPSMETGIATELNEYCYFNTFGYQYTDVVTYDVKGEKLYYANTGGVLERRGWFNFSGTVTYAGDGKPWSAAGQRGYANGDCTLMKDTFSYDENGNLCYMQGNGAVTYDF